MRHLTIGIAGAGVISHVYIRDIKRLYSDHLTIKSVAALHAEHAQEVAEKYEIPVACSIEEMLQDPEIDLVVNLTPPKAHTELNKQILKAGKHLFCEKPFALTLEDALEIKALAEEKGLIIGCAPDSFLGSSLSTCRKLLQDGWIGKPLYVSANMMTSGVETWHPYPEAFYAEGGGPVFDMGGYYFTALVTMLGAAERITAVSGTGFAQRTIYTQPRFGQKVDVNVPTFYSFIIQMKSGVIVNMNMSFDIWKTSLPNFEIYGTDGTLMVPDPNMHGGTPKVFRKEQVLAKCFGGNDTGEGNAFAVPELNQDIGEYVRCLGVEAVYRSIAEGAHNPCNPDLAVHVTEMMLGVMKAAETGLPYEMTTDPGVIEPA